MITRLGPKEYLFDSEALVIVIDSEVCIARIESPEGIYRFSISNECLVQLVDKDTRLTWARKMS